MSRLDELIVELCPDGVDYIALGELLKNNDAEGSVAKKDYQETGKIPIIDQGQSYIAGYTDDESAVPPILPCIIFGDHTRIIKYSDRKFAQGDSGTRVFISSDDNTDIKYLYYALCNLKIVSRGYNRHWTIVKDMKIPHPPLQVQLEIVKLLDAFTELTAELTAELTVQKKRYKYYRNCLFASIIEEDFPFAWRTMGEACILSAGGDVPKENYSQEKTKYCNIPIYSNGIGNNALYGYTDIPKITDPCVTIAARGTIGYCALRKSPFYPIIRLICVIPKEELLADYLKYYLDTIKFHVPTSGIPQLTIPMIAKYRIPIPSIIEQKRIVSILDRFDTICNDLTSGLPAEIEARKKQYEYYRNKLLTFKEKSA